MSERVTYPGRRFAVVPDSADERAAKAREAMRRGDHVAAGWYLYGVGPSGTRPKDCK